MSAPGETRAAPELVRFFIVALGGLMIDIATATALIMTTGMADIPAAACGLLAGMIFNYFMHLGWTFQDQDRSASVGHFLRFAMGVAVTLVIRAGVLHAIEVAGWQAFLPPYVRLGIGAATSFVLSYLINRFLIFTSEPKDAE